jgi:hypothetical protein
VRVDQKAVNFWLILAANYKEHRGQSREKQHGQLKFRWHRINLLGVSVTNILFMERKVKPRVIP